MNRLLILFALLLSCAGCLKLEEKEFYLDNNCQECEQQLVREAVEIEAVHYAEYDWEVGRLNIKYDARNFQISEVYEYLQRQGFSKPTDSLKFRGRFFPDCCRK